MNVTNELRSEYARLVTRRWFFRQCGVGLGSIALASLLENEIKRDGVQNLDTAVELRKYRNSAAPRNTPSTPIQLPDAKELFGNPAQWARNEAFKTIADFRRGGN